MLSPEAKCTPHASNRCVDRIYTRASESRYRPIAPTALLPGGSFPLVDKRHDVGKCGKIGPCQIFCFEFDLKALLNEHDELHNAEGIENLRFQKIGLWIDVALIPALAADIIAKHYYFISHL